MSLKRPALAGLFFIQFLIIKNHKIQLATITKTD